MRRAFSADGCFRSVAQVIVWPLPASGALPLVLSDSFPGAAGGFGDFSSSSSFSAAGLIENSRPVACAGVLDASMFASESSPVAFRPKRLPKSHGATRH